MASLQHSASIPVQAFGEREAPIRDAAALLASLRHLVEPDEIGLDVHPVDALPPLSLDAAYRHCKPPPQPSPRAGRESWLLPRPRGRLGGGHVEKPTQRRLPIARPKSTNRTANPPTPPVSNPNPLQVRVRLTPLPQRGRGAGVRAKKRALPAHSEPKECTLTSPVACARVCFLKMRCRRRLLPAPRRRPSPPL